MSGALPLVNIGSKSGRFKYILVQLGQKYLLRGDPTLDYHDKIFKKLQQEAGSASKDLTVLGGGKLNVDFDKKQINLFGKSDTYGAADHTKSKTLLQDKYPNFTVAIDESDSETKK